MKLGTIHLPGFPRAFIGWFLSCARRYLGEPDVHFNIMRQALLGPPGRRFAADARAAGRSLWVWTVNDEAWMEWSIRRAVDGVITDDPALFLEVCRRWGGGEAAGDESGAGDNNVGSRGRASRDGRGRRGGAGWCGMASRRWCLSSLFDWSVWALIFIREPRSGSRCRTG